MKSMTAMNATRKQAGFTIIELVVVILLLGILTATALPRFMDVTDEAHAAVVDAVEGGLATGNALFRAQWVAEGQPDTAVSEFNLFASTVTGAGLTAGYPKGDAATIDATACLDIYNGVLQQGGRPEAESITTANAANDATVEAAIEGVSSASAVIAARLVQAAAIADSDECVYYYIGQYRSGASGTGANAPTRVIPAISYNIESGAISRSTFTLQED